MAPVWSHTFSHVLPVGCLIVPSWAPVLAVRGCRAVPAGEDALRLQVLLQAGEHCHAGPQPGSCDREAAGTHTSVAIAQAYRTRFRRKLKLALFRRGYVRLNASCFVVETLCFWATLLIDTVIFRDLLLLQM